jgi:carboxyl-terminal processing protease
MLPASNRGAGGNFGFPDVCLTPVGPAVVPIPYPNVALNAMAASFSPNVLFTMMPALNMGTVIPLTLGDQPGVANPTVMGPAEYTTGVFDVLVNGLPAISLTNMSTGNDMNDGLASVLVPSVTNVFLMFAGGAGEQAGAPDTPGEALGRLARALPRDGSAVSDALLGEGVGYVRVAVFSSDVPARVYTAVRRLEAAGMRELVLDLRHNPGGELNAALELAGDFLEPGSELARVVDDDGDETVHSARGEPSYRFPLLVLVDRATASAAELFAGCLQAHGRARLAGEPTYGKGAGAALVPLPDGSLRARTARFTLPGGRPVQGHGLVPDLPAPDDAIAEVPDLLHHVG